MAVSYPSRQVSSQVPSQVTEEMARLRSDRESFGKLIGALAEESANLVRDEISLAQYEFKEKVKGYRSAATMLAIGGVTSLFAVLALGTAFIIWLGQYIGNWPAAALTGLALAIIAGIFLLVGKSKLSHLSPKLEETTKTLEENKEWLKELT